MADECFEVEEVDDEGDEGGEGVLDAEGVVEEAMLVVETVGGDKEVGFSVGSLELLSIFHRMFWVCSGCSSYDKQNEHL